MVVFKIFCLVQLLFYMACNIQSSTFAMTTVPAFYGDASESCQLGMSSRTLSDKFTTFTSKPRASYSNVTLIQWKAYGKSRLEVEIKVCDYTAVMAVSFSTRNVKSSGIIVDDGSFYGAVNQHGNVEVSTGLGGMSTAKAGWVIKIVVTPKNYSQPVIISGVAIGSCQYGYDCFENCGMYVVNSLGCKEPICAGDPCNHLSCSDGYECRLIDNQDEYTFPSLMTPGVQLWDCVEASRTGYGCTCKKYGVGANQCPTCKCAA